MPETNQNVGREHRAGSHASAGARGNNSGLAVVLTAIAVVVSVVALVISVFSLVLSLNAKTDSAKSVSGSRSSSSVQSKTNEGQKTVTEEIPQQSSFEADATSDIDNGNWHIKIAKVSRTGSSLDIAFEVTNNTAESSSHYISLEGDAYQNGVQLEVDPTAPIDPSNKIQPRTTITLHKVYKLTDDKASVHVDITYLTDKVGSVDLAAIK